MLRRFLITSIAFVCALPALGDDHSITALVASSTKDAVGDIAQAFTAKTGISVKVSPGASNALAQQIINGAPADVFVSASHEWMQAIEREELVIESHPLVVNRLALIVWKDAKGSISAPRDLLKEDVRRIALAGENVPAGKYAEQALRFHEVFDALKAARKIVRGTDVRSAMAYVERGEAEAGIVYATDARLANGAVVAYTFDAEAHDPIICPAALLKSGAANDAARKFYEYLRSSAATEIFHRHGFSAPPEETAPATKPIRDSAN